MLYALKRNLQHLQNKTQLSLQVEMVSCHYSKML